MRASPKRQTLIAVFLGLSLGYLAASGRLAQAVTRVENPGDDSATTTDAIDRTSASNQGTVSHTDHRARCPECEGPAAIRGEGAGGCPQRAHRADRRHGVRPVERLRRADPDADVRAAGQQTASGYNQFHTTALCSPTRAALLTGRNHHVVQHGLDHGDGDRVPGPNRPAARTAWPRWPRCCGSTASPRPRSASRTRPPPGRSARPGPTNRWPTRSGFDKFYGFIGGEANQWAPIALRRA